MTDEEIRKDIEYRVARQLPGISPDWQIQARDLLLEYRKAVLEEAAEICCDYCGGRMWDSPGKEKPRRDPGESNWYHRRYGPCKAGAIHTVLAVPKG